MGGKSRKEESEEPETNPEKVDAALVSCTPRPPSPTHSGYAKMIVLEIRSGSVWQLEKCEGFEVGGGGERWTPKPSQPSAPRLHSGLWDSFFLLPSGSSPWWKRMDVGGVQWVGSGLMKNAHGCCVEAPESAASVCVRSASRSTNHTQKHKRVLSPCLTSSHLFQLWAFRWNWTSFRRNSGQPADRYDPSGSLCSPSISQPAIWSDPDALNHTARMILMDLIVWFVES